ncbi:hypothetical protein QAD02_022974 [Eretmocerus hayati]|uniref:Uncharacterized protein n=1 Tax=Eretmocerus hayati TaxID=131215 RepID=A0ACC2PZE6_9HYME|nr:hypothetical protein QAD02_022974 [Eretmocerus hayati]
MSNILHTQGKFLDHSHQLNGIRPLNQYYNGVFKASQFPHKISDFQYSTAPKPNPSRSTSPEPEPVKTDHPNQDCYAPPVVQKPSIFQKFKQMAKDYWYILVPVHVVTSLGWVFVFYISVKNGVDIVGILKSLNLSERYLAMLEGSNAGHWAVTYALYKVFTPIRYTVTIGGTTMSIRYLNKWGYLKFKKLAKEKDAKLAQSIKCAAEHKAAFGKTGNTNKSNQTQSQKT